jgi:hypothetical protein
MDRYIGLDVHSASCTAGVLSAKGRRLSSTVLETNGKVLVEFLRLIPGTRHLIIEEGTQASWLHEILSPHVHEMVVMGAPKTKGQKNDKLDAFALAEKLRTLVRDVGQGRQNEKAASSVVGCCLETSTNQRRRCK